MRRVVVVQHVAVEEPGRIDAALGRAGVAVDRVRVHANDEVPVRIGDAVGLVVMGGPMGVHDRDRLAHLPREIALIEDALAHDVAILGVCLGSQLLAHALGARVFASGDKEIGWLDVTATADARADPLFSRTPAVFTALHWHGDVFELPAGAVSLARSEKTEHQAFRHGSAWGLLFHLEATPTIVDGMTRAFSDELAHAAIDGATLRRKARENEAILDDLASPLFDAWCEGASRRRRDSNPW